MFQNYIKIAVRNLVRNKLHSTINIVGLAIGISACFTIYQIVKYENSYDAFHPEKEQIYRVYTQFSGAMIGTNPGVCAPLAPAIEEQLTSVEIVAPFQTLHQINVKVESNIGEYKNFKEQETVAFMTPSYFQLFSSYKWLAGTPENALNQPNKVVLTESRAAFYFNTQKPLEVVGKEIRYQDSLLVTVSGIVKDLEQASDFYFTDFISYSTIENSWMKDQIDLNNWRNHYAYSQLFLKKRANTSAAEVEASINDLLAQNVEQEENSNWIVSLKLQKLSDLHFTGISIFTNTTTSAHRPTLRILIGIAFILLLIACVNFINLATTQSLQRSKEIGVRKVLGSKRGELIAQFLSETLVLTSVAAILSLGLTQLSFHYFKDLLPAGLVFDFLNPSLILFLLGLVVVMSLLAGAYPAFVQSSFRPILSLKNQPSQTTSSKNSAWIRKGLIVFQFGVSFILIMGTLVVGKQLDYIFEKDLGFNQEAILNFNVSWRQPAENKKLLREELARLPEVLAISNSEAPPLSPGASYSDFQFEIDGQLEEKSIERTSIDEHFLDVYGINLVAGRSFQANQEEKSMLINKKMLDMMNLESAEEAIGKTIEWGERGSYSIIGVLEDYHQHSMNQAINPMILSQTSNSNFFSIKLAATNLSESIEKMTAIWNRIYPEANFNYSFFDDAIAQLYEKERRTAKLLNAATTVAIFISCIGLFGLVSFSVTQRIREIGIRKILGASASNIVALISKDFVLLVLLAIVLTTPIAWWLVNKWLSDFVYHIDIQWWMFVVAGMLAIGIALLTVSMQSVKAALANPVESLRNE